MVKVVWDREAHKDFDALDAHIQQRIIAKIHWLSQNLASISPKPLHQELHGLYKLRVGDYRVVYSIRGQILTIEEVGHRRGIYR